MKKYILLFGFGFVVLASCDKDDFCIEPVTPNLVLRFYDNTNTTAFKTVERLSVWVEGKDTLPDYTSVNVDSIAIPLDPLNNQTVYSLKMNSIDGNLVNNIIDHITISYDIEEVYVSRSCGFKVIFNNLTITSDNVWIQTVDPSADITVNNESSAHAQIFH